MPAYHLLELIIARSLCYTAPKIYFLRFVQCGGPLSENSCQSLNSLE